MTSASSASEEARPPQPEQSPPDRHVHKRPRAEGRVVAVAAEDAVTAGPAGRGDATQKLFVQLLSDKARVPTKGSAMAAGWDLFAAKTMTVPGRDKAVVPTDISIHVPAGTYGRVAPRSGLAVKHFVDVGAGVVDEDYRGPLGVVLFNFSADDFQITEGDRIAQLILEKICPADIEVVESLAKTERGSGGFGSTGVSLTKVAVADTKIPII